jgi:hypothetical protein
MVASLANVGRLKMAKSRALVFLITAKMRLMWRLEKDAPGAWGIVCAVVESVVKTLVCSALEWVSLPSGGR